MCLVGETRTDEANVIELGAEQFILEQATVSRVGPSVGVLNVCLVAVDVAGRVLLLWRGCIGDLASTAVYLLEWYVAVSAIGPLLGNTEEHIACSNNEQDAKNKS